MKLELKKIEKRFADEFYSKFEHLGNCGLGVWHFGLFCDISLVSVVSFGTVNFDPNRSFIGSIAKKYGLNIFQLTRGGTRYDAPKNIPTRAIKLALRLLHEQSGDSIIVAYSDTKWNEVGTIYQASNFLYLGETEPKGQSDYIIAGKRVSGWTVRKKYGTRDLNKLKQVEPGIVRVPLNKKYKYIFLNISPKKKKRVAAEFFNQIQAYPKRLDATIGSMRIIHKQLGLYKESDYELNLTLEN